MTTQSKNIIDALHVADLPLEEQEDLLLDISELIFKGTLVRLIERMDEKTREEFDTLLDANAPEEEIEAFIQAHVPDADSAVEETVAELTSDILAVTSE